MSGSRFRLAGTRAHLLRDWARRRHKKRVGESRSASFDSPLDGRFSPIHHRIPSDYPDSQKTPEAGHLLRQLVSPSSTPLTIPPPLTHHTTFSRLKKIKCLQPSPEARCEACKAAKIQCRFRDRERYFAERSRAITNPGVGSGYGDDSR